MFVSARFRWTTLATAIVLIIGCSKARLAVEDAPARAEPIALPAPPAPAAPSAPAEPGAALDRIEVTGSRIAASTSESASPVMEVASGDRAAAAPAVQIADGESPGATRAGVLTAGDYDDLLNPQLYARYAETFLLAHPQTALPFVDTRSAVRVRVIGRDGEPVSFAVVTIQDAQRAPRQLFTAANGMALFFPGLDALPEQLQIRVAAPGTALVERRMALDSLPDDRTVTVQLPIPGRAPQALDLLLVIDTTGSMTDELKYLQTELAAITASLHRTHPQLDVRVGLIAYRDVGDEYVTRSFALTEDLAGLRRDLAAQQALGGGDYPEAVQQAFADANRAEWRKDAVKALLHVADAPPHGDHMGATWNEAVQLRQRGVHIVPVAASGVADDAQYLMRSAAALTQSRYLFLTDDSGVGLPHAEPDVPCYVVTRLDGLISRVLATLVSGRRVEPAAANIIRTSGDYARGVCLPAAGERPSRG